MLGRFFGVLWVVTGIYWLIKPDSLKNRLKRKMTRKMRWLIFSIIIALGTFLTASSFRLEGLTPKIMAIAGMFIIIRSIIAITSRTTEKALEWLGDRPLYIFRIWAVVVLSTGSYLFFMSK